MKEDRQAVTVGKLIEDLSKLPEDMPVYVEGFVGDLEAGGVRAEESRLKDGEEYAIVYRLDSKI